MDEREIKLLMDYVKQRYDDASMDYKSFNGDIDTDLTYAEQKRITIEQLSVLLPNVEPKLKRECVMDKKEAQVQLDAKLKAEQDKQEAEIKARLEQDIANITKDSKELERLYEYPIKCIEMVANKKAKGLLLYGETSLGKSYRVKEVLKRLGKKDYFFVSGHITPMRFYEKMFYAKDGLVIFDDVNILDNLITLNMIKAGLNENSGNVVEYHTTKKMEIPSSFVFNGQMIILLNEIPKKNEHMKAIESRVIKHHLKFTREEIIKIIFEIATRNDIDGTTLADRINIAKFIKDNTNRATQNFNIRLYLQAIDFFKYDKDNWKELISGQIQTDEYATLLIQGCSTEEWEQETGLSSRTMKRLKKELGLTRAYGVVK